MNLVWLKYSPWVDSEITCPGPIIRGLHCDLVLDSAFCSCRLDPIVTLVSRNLCFYSLGQTTLHYSAAWLRAPAASWRPWYFQSILLWPYWFGYTEPPHPQCSVCTARSSWAGPDFISPEWGTRLQPLYLATPDPCRITARAESKTSLMQNADPQTFITSLEGPIPCKTWVSNCNLCLQWTAMELEKSIVYNFGSPGFLETKTLFKLVKKTTSQVSTETISEPLYVYPHPNM